MELKTTKFLSCIFSTLFSFQAFATDLIKVTVKTNERNAVAIGFTVDSRDYGTLGKSYSGKGPANKEYLFGYKKDSLFGENVACGSLILTRDSTVVLMIQNNTCIAILG